MRDRPKPFKLGIDAGTRSARMSGLCTGPPKGNSAMIFMGYSVELLGFNGAFYGVV